MSDAGAFDLVIRNADIATSRNTGPATGPPNPADPPVVLFNVTATTICGFTTGANPTKLALYLCV